MSTLNREHGLFLWFDNDFTLIMLTIKFIANEALGFTVQNENAYVQRVILE